VQVVDARLLREAKLGVLANTHAAHSTLRRAILKWHAAAAEASSRRARDDRHTAVWGKIRSWLADTPAVPCVGAGSYGLPGDAGSVLPSKASTGSARHAAPGASARGTAAPLQAVAQSRHSSVHSIDADSRDEHRGAWLDRDLPVAHIPTADSQAQVSDKMGAFRTLSHPLEHARRAAGTAGATQRLSDMLSARLEASLMEEAPVFDIHTLLASCTVPALQAACQAAPHAGGELGNVHGATVMVGNSREASCLSTAGEGQSATAGKVEYSPDDSAMHGWWADSSKARCGGAGKLCGQALANRGVAAAARSHTASTQQRATAAKPPQQHLQSKLPRRVAAVPGFRTSHLRKVLTRVSRTSSSTLNPKGLAKPRPHPHGHSPGFSQLPEATSYNGDPLACTTGPSSLFKLLPKAVPSRAPVHKGPYPEEPPFDPVDTADMTSTFGMLVGVPPVFAPPHKDPCPEQPPCASHQTADTTDVASGASCPAPVCGVESHHTLPKDEDLLEPSGTSTVATSAPHDIMLLIPEPRAASIRHSTQSVTGSSCTGAASNDQRPQHLPSNVSQSEALSHLQWAPEQGAVNKEGLDRQRHLALVPQHRSESTSGSVASDEMMALRPALGMGWHAQMGDRCAVATGGGHCDARIMVAPRPATSEKPGKGRSCALGEQRVAGSKACDLDGRAKGKEGTHVPALSMHAPSENAQCKEKCSSSPDTRPGLSLCIQNEVTQDKHFLDDHSVDLDLAAQEAYAWDMRCSQDLRAALLGGCCAPATIQAASFAHHCGACNSADLEAKDTAAPLQSSCCHDEDSIPAQTTDEQSPATPERDTAPSQIGEPTARSAQVEPVLSQKMSAELPPVATDWQQRLDTLKNRSQTRSGTTRWPATPEPQHTEDLAMTPPSQAVSCTGGSLVHWGFCSEAENSSNGSGTGSASECSSVLGVGTCTCAQRKQQMEGTMGSKMDSCSLRAHAHAQLPAPAASGLTVSIIADTAAAGTSRRLEVSEIVGRNGTFEQVDSCGAPSRYGLQEQEEEADDDDDLAWILSRARAAAVRQSHS
jgi:hypothetical protein